MMFFLIKKNLYMMYGHLTKKTSSMAVILKIWKPTITKAIIAIHNNN